MLQRNDDRRCRRGELDGVGAKLVEHLRDQLGRTVERHLARRHPEIEHLVAVRGTIPVDATGDHARKIEALAFRVGQAFLEPCRFADPGDDVGEPRETLLGPLDVDARIARKRLQREVVDRRAHHRDRRAQLVREAARHRFLIARVFGEPGERAAEAARQVPDFVAGVRPGERTAHAPARVDRRFGLVAQPTDAR